MWDSTFGLPVPPINAVAPTVVANAATAIFAGIAILALLYGFKHWRDSGRPILLLILVGGGLTTLAEPLVDLMGACWHPNIGQGIAFEFLGRYMPWWIVAVYFAFFGAQGSLIYCLLKKGLTMNALRLVILIPMIADVMIEETALPTGLYIYGGQQPLILLKSTPLWWVPCNSIGMFLGVALVYVCAPYLKGFKAIIIPLLLPIGDLMLYAAIGLPSFIVINTAGLSSWVVQAGGIGTYILAFLVFHAISLIIAVDSPLRQPGQLNTPLSGVLAPTNA